MENKPSDPNPADQNPSSIDVNNDSHAFVIRIWLEEAEREGTTALWRGYITHVLDNRRHYFQDLSDIVQFISPYLKTP